MMEKKIIVAVLAMVLLMMMFAAMPVMATKGTAVSGRWVGIASSMSYSNHRTEGGNVFLDIYNKGTYVAGDIIGSFEQTFSAVVHFGSPKVVANLDPSNPSANPDASFNWKDMDRTFTGTVLGVSGGFTMRLQSTGYGNNLRGPAYYDLEGTWVIISGTGDLANLHGQGTWWHSRTGFAGLEYEGLVHFDP